MHKQSSSCFVVITSSSGYVYFSTTRILLYKHIECHSHSITTDIYIDKFKSYLDNLPRISIKYFSVGTRLLGKSLNFN
jgi:hypothetical protein